MAVRAHGANLMGDSCWCLQKWRYERMVLVLDVQKDPWAPVPFNLLLDASAVFANLHRRYMHRSLGLVPNPAPHQHEV